MFDAHDRYVLALGVLDGDKDTHKILGDMLEEQGDRGLAQWARARKGKRTKRVDFVLGMLPYKTSLQLGCVFFEHSLNVRRSAKLNLFQRWQDAQSDQKLERLTIEIQDLAHQTLAGFYPGFAREYSDALGQAIYLASKADKLTQAGDDRRAAARANEARDAVRRVAKTARQVAVPTQNELLWQISHIQSVLNELLEKDV